MSESEHATPELPEEPKGLKHLINPDVKKYIAELRAAYERANEAVRTSHEAAQNAIARYDAMENRAEAAEAALAQANAALNKIAIWPNEENEWDAVDQFRLIREYARRNHALQE